MMKTPIPNTKIRPIEDNYPNNSLVRYFSASKKLELFVAEKGKKGIHYLKILIDTLLVLLDIMIIDINGFKLLHLLRQYSLTLPIITQTDYSKSFSYSHCIETRISDVNYKPFT